MAPTRKPTTSAPVSVSNPVFVELNTGWDKQLILSPGDLSLLIEILSRSQCATKEWNDWGGVATYLAIPHPELKATHRAKGQYQIIPEAHASEGADYIKDMGGRRGAGLPSLLYEEWLAEQVAATTAQLRLSEKV